jgi:molybdate transport system regulatory protein
MGPRPEFPVPKPPAKSPEPALDLRIRFYLGGEIALGPGKAELLEAIRETGSIAAAGRQMDMSYRRAWLLVDTMNRCFGAPLVSTEKGGATRGGATLTPLGDQVLARYRSLEAKAARAAAKDLAALSALLGGS